MTQDIGPEDEALQGAEEPVDQQDSRTKRRSAWPWVALAVVLLLLIWLLWQYLEGVRNAPSGTTVTITRVVPATPDGDGTITEMESEAVTRTVEVDSGVPDVVGMTRSAAISALQAAGYRALVTDLYGSSKPVNTVFHQDPTGGAMLEQGGTVRLLVQQRSRPTVTMPKLTGLSQSEAERKLNALGLEIVVSYAPKGTQSAGIVRSQWPLAGDDVVEGGKVQIQINVKP
jgi:hypothetical protein